MKRYLSGSSCWAAVERLEAMKDVGCAGILVADTFCGPMAELPREGQLLAVDAMPVKPGGCAANVAIGLAKQGFNISIVGCVGKDASVNVLTDSFNEYGIDDAGLVRVDSYPTSKTVILLVEGQDRRYVHMFGANAAFTLEHISKDWISGLRIFYLGGLFGLPGVKIAQLAELLGFCRTKGVTTIVDIIAPQQVTNFDEIKSLLPLIDCFLPNNDEAEKITAKTTALDQIQALLSAGAKTVVITQGNKGAIAARGDKLWRSGIYEMAAKDPSGCGDAFAAGIITGILRGWEMPRTLRYASALGVSVTQAIGTTDGLFSADEAESFVNSHPLEVSCDVF